MSSSLRGRRAVCATCAYASERISSSERQDRLLLYMEPPRMRRGVYTSATKSHKLIFCAFCRQLPAGSVVDPAQFLHASIIDRALDDLISKQRKHSSTQKQRPRVSIPINARRTATIVNRFIRLRSQFSDFAELQ